MKPHIWKSTMLNRRGLWVCCLARITTPSINYGRVRLPVGEVFYGATPAAAYERWKDSHVGSS